MGAVSIGSNSYNVYGASVAAADVYVGARIGADAWLSASATLKAQALISATRAIQAWLFARGADLDPAAAVDATITNASYELAFLLTQDSMILDATTMTTNERKLKAGSAEIEYFRPVRGGRFPASVQSLLNNWMDASGYAAFLVASAYGTANETTLKPDDYLVVGVPAPIDDESVGTV